MNLVEGVEREAVKVWDDTNPKLKSLRKRQFWRKSHIDRVAAILREEPGLNTKRRLVEKFAAEFKRENVLFDESRFSKLCEHAPISKDDPVFSDVYAQDTMGSRGGV